MKLSITPQRHTRCCYICTRELDLAGLTMKEDREHGENIAGQLQFRERGRGEVGVPVCGLQTKMSTRGHTEAA